MYKQAMQQKLRIPTTIGNLSLEQVYDLPITHPSKICLAGIAKNLYQQLEDTRSTGLDFLDESTTKDPDNELRFAIIKDIIETKRAEATAKTTQKLREQEIKMYENALETVKADSMMKLSPAQLEAKLAELKAGK
jgi:hypothetical protein